MSKLFLRPVFAKQLSADGTKYVRLIRAVDLVKYRLTLFGVVDVLWKNGFLTPGWKPSRPTWTNWCTTNKPPDPLSWRLPEVVMHAIWAAIYQVSRGAGR